MHKSVLKIINAKLKSKLYSKFYLSGKHFFDNKCENALMVVPY